MWKMLLSLFAVILTSSGTSATQTSCTNSCNNVWRLVATTTTTGEITQGSKVDLAKAVLSGDEIRIVQGGYVVSVQNAHIIGDDVCAQSLFHISKDGYDAFKEDVYWYFANYCTTGQKHVTRYYVGKDQLFLRSTYEREVRWYARSVGNTPLRLTSGGIAVTGSVDNLIADVKAGYDVRIATEYEGYTAPMDSLEIPSSENQVIGQSLWHVSQEKLGSNYVFMDDAYWWFTHWVTNSKLQMSRWKIGDHDHLSADSVQQHMTWHTDSCWHLAYRHDADGNRLEGSLEYLRSSLLEGHRIKVVYEHGGTINVEPDDIRIRGGHVNAVILGMLKKDFVDTTMFDPNAQWYWRILTTTGTETTLRVKVGKYEEQGRTNGTRAVSWFTDTRQWRKQLVNDAKGNVQSGSKSDLITKVKTGKKIRYTLTFPDDDIVAVRTVDNLSIDGNELGAMHVRSVSIQATPGSTAEVSFKAHPYWWFTVSSTTGKVDISRWTVGEHTPRGHDRSSAAMEWFADL